MVSIIDIAEQITEAEEASVGKEVVALTVVPAAEDGRTHALAPFDAARELPALLQLAKTLSGARGMIPAHLKSEGEIVAALLAGRELGIPPMMSLRTIHLIDGKVSLGAEVQLGLMQRAGVRSQWIESTDTRAHLRLVRPGYAPHDQVYTMDDARAAGLAAKQNWQRHPRAMLRARAVSAAAKAYGADILTGVYTPDELDEIRDRDMTRVSAPVADALVHDGHVAADDMAAARERDNAHKAASKPIADEWIQVQLRAIVEAAAKDTAVARRTFQSWIVLNEGERQTLHKSQRSRVWTAIARAHEVLSKAGCFDGEHEYSLEDVKRDMADAPRSGDAESEDET